MNEQIQKLAEQTYSQLIIDNGDFDLRKFADKLGESIIRECIVQIQLTTARDPQHTPQYKQSVGHIHRIRQHFGIE